MTSYMTLNRPLPYGIGPYMRRDFNGRIQTWEARCYGKYRRKLSEIREKIYLERKEKERRLLEFRNERKERRKRPKSAIQLLAGLAIALTLRLSKKNPSVLPDRKRRCYPRPMILVLSPGE